MSTGMIMDISNFLTTAEVAERAGVLPQAIANRALQLNLKPYIRGIAFWSPEQVALLVEPRKPGRKPKNTQERKEPQ